MKCPECCEEVGFMEDRKPCFPSTESEDTGKCPRCGKCVADNDWLKDGDECETFDAEAYGNRDISEDFLDDLDDRVSGNPDLSEVQGY